MATTELSGATLPVWVRPFVYGVVVLLLVCAVAGLEWWPFTGFRLFSQLRSSTDISYEIDTVSHAGVEQPVLFGAFPRSFQQYSRLATRMASLSTAERNRVCRAISDELASRGTDVAEIRIYRVVRPIPTRPNQHPAPVSRKVRWTCGTRS